MSRPRRSVALYPWRDCAARMLADGMTFREIARLVGASPETVSLVLRLPQEDRCPETPVPSCICTNCGASCLSCGPRTQLDLVDTIRDLLNPVSPRK
jgi:hypothetical protein